MANAIAEMIEARVAGIFDPRELLAQSIASKVVARDGEQRSQNGTAREERREPARAGAAHHAHEHRFELVVARVRGSDLRTALERDAAEKAPALRAPLGLGAESDRRALGYDLDAQAGRHAVHQRRGLGRVRAGRVIEGGDGDDALARGVIRCERGVQQRHRVATTRNGEHHTLCAELARDERRYRIIHMYSLTPLAPAPQAS